jgi:hypothetical protein
VAQKSNVIEVPPITFHVRAWSDRELENNLWFCLNFYEGCAPDLFYEHVMKEAKRRGKL